VTGGDRQADDDLAAALGSIPPDLHVEVMASEGRRRVEVWRITELDGDVELGEEPCPGGGGRLAVAPDDDVVAALRVVIAHATRLAGRISADADERRGAGSEDAHDVLAGDSAAVRRVDRPNTRAGLGLSGVQVVDPDRGRAAAVRNEARLAAHRAALYKAGLTREQAAERLPVPETNAIDDLVRKGELVAFDGEDGLRLPAWQFDPAARRGHLEGIDRVAAVFPGRILALSSWMTAANPLLGGRSPRQALLDGDVDAVTVAAEYLLA
jgi:hypothetical protein